MNVSADADDLKFAQDPRAPSIRCIIRPCGGGRESDGRLIAAPTERVLEGIFNHPLSIPLLLAGGLRCW